MDELIRAGVMTLPLAGKQPKKPQLRLVTIGAKSLPNHELCQYHLIT